MTYLTEILIKLTRALAQSNSKLGMVRSNYICDGIELIIVDNETKQIALLKMTAIPEPEKPWTDYAPNPQDMNQELKEDKLDEARRDALDQHDCKNSPDDGCEHNDGFGRDEA